MKWSRGYLEFDSLGSSGFSHIETVGAMPYMDE